MSSTEWISIWEDSGAEVRDGHQTQGKNDYKPYTLNIHNAYMPLISQAIKNKQ